MIRTLDYKGRKVMSIYKRWDIYQISMSICFPGCIEDQQDQPTPPLITSGSATAGPLQLGHQRWIKALVLHLSSSRSSMGA